MGRKSWPQLRLVIGMDIPLYERISQAEALAKEGKKVDEIISMTGLARVTAQCVVGRVRGELDFSSLRKNSKENAQ